MSEDYKQGAEFAAQMDAADPLAEYREKFHIPLTKSGTPSIYFCGNSLGLQPKATEAALLQELKD